MNVNNVIQSLKFSTKANGETNANNALLLLLAEYNGEQENMIMIKQLIEMKSKLNQEAVSLQNCIDKEKTALIGLLQTHKNLSNSIKDSIEKLNQYSSQMEAIIFNYVSKCDKIVNHLNMINVKDPKKSVNVSNDECDIIVQQRQCLQDFHHLIIESLNNMKKLSKKFDIYIENLMIEVYQQLKQNGLVLKDGLQLNNNFIIVTFGANNATNCNTRHV